jgi:protein-S-isoprenylcysteine O-methyltransferase Ste14
MSGTANQRSVHIMALQEEFNSSGQWLFRWRSLLPLLIMALIMVLMLFDPDSEPPWTDGRIWQVSSAVVSVLGLIVRIITVGRVPHDTSRRSTRERSASELNHTGMYSIVRHPLYLGNYIMWLGVALAPGIWWLTVLISLAYALYYERIMYSEEEFLRAKFGREYLDWARSTPAIIPNLKLWKPSNLPFSWLTVLRREYASAFAMVLAFTVIGFTDDYEARFPFKFDYVHVIIFTLGFAIYALLRFMKRHTQWLNVEGR